MKPFFTLDRCSFIRDGIRLFLPVVFLSFAVTYAADAQCDEERFLEFITDDVDVESDIVYGENINADDQNQILNLDVYSPAGDTETNRPLIIMAHGGSFVGGSKTGNDVVPLCTDFAKMGYVAASIEYRLGASDPGQFLPTPASATRAVWRGYHDARAAIRFFRKSVVEEGNPYGINPDKIFISGVSAGGFIALHVGYLNSEDEFPEGVDSNFPGIDEDIEGNSGNPGYSSEVAGVLNIAGAIGDTAWMQATEPPIVSFHGDEDGTVPYGSDLLVFLGFIQLIEVDGSFSVHAKAEELGMTHCFETHEGYDHVPHQTNAAIYDTTLTMSKNFLYHLVCDDAEAVCAYENSPLVTNVEDIVRVDKTSVYPNPASEQLFVDLSDYNGQPIQLRVYNAMGAMVRDYGVVTQSVHTVNRGELADGIYLIEVLNGESRETVRVVLR